MGFITAERAKYLSDYHKLAERINAYIMGKVNLGAYYCEILETEEVYKKIDNTVKEKLSAAGYTVDDTIKNEDGVNIIKIMWDNPNPPTFTKSEKFYKTLRKFVLDID